MKEEEQDGYVEGRDARDEADGRWGCIFGGRFTADDSDSEVSKPDVALH